MNQVDLVARVQGFLQAINYQDGAVLGEAGRYAVTVIEPAPYEARLATAGPGHRSHAGAGAAHAGWMRSSIGRRLLGRTDFSSQSTVDQALATRDSNQANVANQQAAVTQAAINLAYTRVTAPFDGQVMAHQVSIGSLVGVTGPTTLSTIIQLDPIRVVGAISEQDVLRIKESYAETAVRLPSDIAKVPIEVGLMNETGYPHHGTLDYVAPFDIDPSRNRHADYPRSPAERRAGLAAGDVRAGCVLPGTATQKSPLRWLVPDLALGADQGGRYLLVVDKDNIVQQRPVRTGQADGDLRVIMSGLSADDRVVVSGLQKAIPGTKVAPNEVEISSGQPSGGTKP